MRGEWRGARSFSRLRGSETARLARPAVLPALEPDLALDGGALGRREAAGLEGARQHARGQDVQARGCREIAAHLARDDDGGGVDVGVDLGALGDHDASGYVDLALEAAVHVEITLARDLAAKRETAAQDGAAGIRRITHARRREARARRRIVRGAAQSEKAEDATHRPALSRHAPAWSARDQSRRPDLRSQAPPLCARLTTLVPAAARPCLGSKVVLGLALNSALGSRLRRLPRTATRSSPAARESSSPLPARRASRRTGA